VSFVVAAAALAIAQSKGSLEYAIGIEKRTRHFGEVETADLRSSKLRSAGQEADIPDHR
jgi:hypothetical protein